LSYIERLLLVLTLESNRELSSHSIYQPAIFRKNNSFINLQNLSNVDVTTLKFFMYDLPEDYWWRWPKNTSDCVDSGYVSHNHSQLSGIGKLLDINSGLFFSWHGSIFSSMFNRLKRSKRRTRNPDEASLFIIPYGRLLIPPLIFLLPLI